MPLSHEQKLTYVIAILEEATEGEVEPIYVAVALQFIKEIQEAGNEGPRNDR